LKSIDKEIILGRFALMMVQDSQSRINKSSIIGAYTEEDAENSLDISILDGTIFLSPSSMQVVVPTLLSNIKEQIPMMHGPIQPFIQLKQELLKLLLLLKSDSHKS